MDLFKDKEIQGNPRLRKLAKHELSELGGEKKAKAFETKVKMAKKMKKSDDRKCPWCGEKLDPIDDIVHGYHHLE